jgi:GNAT superfamily N-acetyltransferase
MRDGDQPEVLRMRRALWPDCTDAENEAEVRACLGDRSPGATTILVAQDDPDGDGAALCGFAECRVRSHADGCDPSRAVGFLEGWYVDPTHRRRGVGAALLGAVEAWTRAAGCVELGSDALIENTEGVRAHLALGFHEDSRVVKLWKRVAAGPASAQAATAPTPLAPLARGNLVNELPEGLPNEVVTALVRERGVRVERIVSWGQVSPPGFWYDQDEHELVLVLVGTARLELEGHGEIALGPGDWVDIPAHLRHRVTFTDPHWPTTWLAIFRRA